MDMNTSAEAARATVRHANELRTNIEYKEFPGLDHYELQQKVTRENYKWLQE
jgi:hypothetical protein